VDDPDLQSLLLIQQGDEQGLVDLMTRHREGLFRFIFRFVHNDADAAELTEATFLKVYQHASRFRSRAKVRTWMFTIAGNLCRDFLRKQRKRKGDISIQAPLGQEPGFSLENQVADDSCSPEQAVASQENVELIEATIDQLPHKLKLPFVYCILEGHSYDECADIINGTRKTVETRIYRARKFLQQELGP
jgi:RNA polymerase sigma-70 factor (ECF subfamily)